MSEDNNFINLLTKRYGNVTPDAIASVLSPQLIQIDTLDKEIIKLDGQRHWRATFTLKITDENYELMQKGRTGKFVPKTFVDGAPGREICKGRIISFLEGGYDLIALKESIKEHLYGLSN